METKGMPSGEMSAAPPAGAAAAVAKAPEEGAPGEPAAPPMLAGEICLDFANTRARRPGEAPREYITDYSSLASWCAAAGLVGQGDAGRLLGDAERRPGEAQATADRARRLREALGEIFGSRAGGRPPETAHLDVLNREWREAAVHLRLVSRGPRYSLAFPPGGEKLERPLWPIVRSGVELLVSPELERVKVCAEEGCTYLFLDRTRNRSRRWCDMRVCGNRAKARRFYRRQRS